MRAPDYIVLLAYLLGILAVGAFGRRHVRTGSEFFLAGRSLGRWPLGLSVMVTAFSAVNFLAFPGEVCRHGLYVLAALPAFLIVIWPISRFFIPFFNGGQNVSAYEFLEKQYGYSVRAMVSALFILWRLLWMSVALYASAKILAAVSGMPLVLLLATCGGIATLYTAFGGLRAVVYTDMVQFFVLSGGIFLATVLAVSGMQGGLREVMDVARGAGRLEPFLEGDLRFFSPDPRIRITLWSGVVGTSVAFFARYGADQAILQRYIAARSIKEARAGFLLNTVAVLVCLVTLVVFGLALYAFAEQNGISGAPPVKAIAQLVRSFPPGLTGIVSAALLAATMSSVDSGINSCTAAIESDFLARRRAGARAVAGRGGGRRVIISLGIGIGVSIASGLVGFMGKDIFQVVSRAVHGLGSPLLALILCAMFARRLTTRAGMLIGGTAGTVVSILVIVLVKPLALHYYAVVNLLITLGLCLGVSAASVSLVGGDRP